MILVLYFLLVWYYEINLIIWDYFDVMRLVWFGEISLMFLDKFIVMRFVWCF